MSRRARFSYCSVFKVNMHNQKSTYSTCGVSSLQWRPFSLNCVSLAFWMPPIPSMPLEPNTWWTEQDVEPVGGCFIGVIGFSCGWSDGMSVEADLKFKRSASVPDTQLLSCEHREYHEYQQRNTYGIFSPLKSIPLAELMEMIVKPQALDQSFWRHIRLSSWQIGSYPGSNRKDAWVRGIGDIQPGLKKDNRGRHHFHVWTSSEWFHGFVGPPCTLMPFPQTSWQDYKLQEQAPDQWNMENDYTKLTYPTIHVINSAQ